MRRKKLRWQRAKNKTRYFARKRQEELDHAVWYAQNAQRNEAIDNLPEEKLDEFLIHEWFHKWKTTIETGYIDGQKAVDFQLLEAIAYLGFRPEHPLVTKARRWLKRLARKPSELSEVFWFLNTEHFGCEDNYLSMASYHAMLHGIKRFLKANDLHKIRVISKSFHKMSKSMHFCWIPKRDIKHYNKCIQIWRKLTDGVEE